MTTLNLQIVSTLDDAYENSSGGVSSTQDVADNTNEFIGLRFQYVLIPPGSTIDTAVLSVMPHSSGDDEPDHPIHGFDEAFTPYLASVLGSFSTRSLTAATVTWTNSDLGADGSTFYSAPDVSAIVQEIIDLSGWLPGNPIGFRIQGSSTQTRDLRIVDYGTNPSNSAKLDIDFTPGDRLFEILRPMATGNYSNLGNTASPAAHYLSIDEIYPLSGDRLFRSNGAAYSDFRVDSALTTESIVAMHAVMHCYKTASGTGDAQVFATFDDVTYTGGTLHNLTESTILAYIDYDFARPGGGDWAPADFKNASGGGFYGVELTGDASTTANVIAFYLVIEYEESTGAEVEIDAALEKVAAALNAGQTQFVEVDTAARRMAVSVSMAQSQLVEADPRLRAVTAAVNAYMRPDAEIDAAVRKLTASLSLSQSQLVTVGASARPVACSISLQQQQLVTVDADLVKAQALVNTYLRPELTIGASLEQVVSALNAETAAVNPLLTVGAAVRGPTASVSIDHQQLLTVAAVLAEAMASLQADNRQEFSIGTVLLNAMAALSTGQSQLLTMGPTLAHPEAEVTLTQIQQLAMTILLQEVSAALSASQPYSFTIATILAHAIFSGQAGLPNDFAAVHFLQGLDLPYRRAVGMELLRHVVYGLDDDRYLKGKAP